MKLTNEQKKKKAAEYQKRYRLNNAEYLRKKTIEYNKVYRLKHPDRIKESARNQRLKYPEKHRERINAWHKKHPEKLREWTNRYRARMRLLKYGSTTPISNKKWASEKEGELMRKYNLSLKEFNLMKEAQSNLCAICFILPKKIVVDHCHTTKRVRGLLCAKCNSGLGFFRDNEDILRQAIAYLNKI